MIIESEYIDLRKFANENLLITFQIVLFNWKIRLHMHYS
jgi:hypothetical protein